ncbi:MAG: hypothetical protein ACLQGP_17500 [Isosphaeraceae bacterium]
MNRIRTWVGGLGISVPCVILTLAMTPGLDPKSSSPAHGRVTYNGHPLDGGYVLFESAAGNFNDWFVGPIGLDGSYSINSTWPQWKHQASRYRISIVPDHGKSEDYNPTLSEDEWSEDVSMSPNFEKLDTGRSGTVDRRLPKRFTDGRTSGLHVTLGREPARVDIELKD